MVEPTNLHGAAPTWLDGEQGWLPRIRRAMAERGANAARTVVVLPYAQLLPLAKRLWAQEVGSGFAPTFTTTQQWAAARQLAMGSERRRPGALSFVAGTDWLQAQVRLEAAGFGRQARALAPQLVELTTALAPYALAQLPAQRPAWMARTRAVLSQGLDAPLLVIEQALVHAAVEWAGQSSYETDVLLQPDAVGPGTELVVLIPGHQADPLLEALQSAWADRACTLDAPTLPEPRPVRWQVAAHAEDEAQRAAACVVARLHDGLQPVALVSTDRALTRRVGALLAEAGVPVRDETGQKLSTLAAGAALMKCLRACQPGADTDTVIDWLIAAPDVAPEAVDALDAALRELAVAQRRQWTTAVAALRDRPERPEHADGGAGGRPTRTWPRTALAEPLEHIEAMREPWQGRRTLAAWQTLYRHTLEACGQWPTLLAWPGGEASLTALGLISGSALALSGWPPERSLSLAGFSAWVDVVLEAVTFVAPTHGDEPVVTLPMAQLLGRPFAALVLAGADERRLPPWPEAPGPWADAQRQALGWPTRMRWRDGVRSAWLTALQAPQADLVWRRLEFSGEALAASPWVQALPLTATEAADPRPTQTVAARPLSRPAPGAGALLGPRVSASAYEDLRACPYRYFARRLLRLNDVNDLDADLDKRDFGQWLHALLADFHADLLANAIEPSIDSLDDLRTRLDRAADQARQTLRLDEAEFLPFSASWPAVREGYLRWLCLPEQRATRFVEAEQWHEQVLGRWVLVGKIDRMDRLRDGPALVLDYKTEATEKTRARIKAGGEDSQLAFYAALLPEDAVQAAYVTVTDSREVAKATQSFRLPDVDAQREALVLGLLDDLTRVAADAPLTAMGEGRACAHCEAGGLCRKDFWGGA